MITPYIFDGAILTATAATQGTVVPALTKRIIKTAHITNTTAAPVAATVYLVPAGGTAGPGNTILPGESIPAGKSYPCDFPGEGLNAGGFVQAMGLGLTFKYTALDIV